MKKFLIVFALFVTALLAFPQTVTLTFTGRDVNNNHVQLDSVLITNLTYGWQETLYCPDTALTMQNRVGIDDNDVGTMCTSSLLQLFQNNPNPFNGGTDVALYVANAGMVTLEITDMNGREIVTDAVAMQAGIHHFRITVSHSGTYIMTARQNGNISAIKMVNNACNNGNIPIVEMMCTPSIQTQIEQNNHSVPKSGSRGTTTNPFNFGNLMEYVGFATINGSVAESQRITQQQGASQTFTLQFEVVQHQLATVTTASVCGVTQTGAIVGGEVTDDGGSVVLDRGVCWDSIATPTISDNCLHIGSGIGVFSDVLTALSPNTTYYVRAYAINGVGVSYGEEESFTTLDESQDGQSCPGNPTVMDADSNIYNTVMIGSQCWMKENLKTTKYDDGTEILQGTSTSTTVAYWYYPGNNSANKATYGLLYNWKAVMHNSSSSDNNPSGVQGVCPKGWHVPSDAEWTQLTDYVSSQSQYVCGYTSTYIAKSLAATVGWNGSSDECAITNNLNMNNDTGFGTLPAGRYYGYYYDFGYHAYFHTSTESNSATIYRRDLSYNQAYVEKYTNNKYDAHSVRCLRN